MKKLSVLTLIYINPNKLGALEEYALSLSTELIRRGHFAAVGFQEYPPPWLMEKFDSSGIEVLKLSLSNGGFKFIRDLRKAIRKYGINLVHATFYDTYSLPLIIATLGRSCNLFYSDQISRIPDDRPKRGLTGIFRFLKSRLYQRFIRTIIADAEFIKECQIQDLFTKPNKLKVIYNGVNLQRFGKISYGNRSHILTKLNIPTDSSVIVTIAQFSWVKGLNYLLDAAKMVIKERPNTIFFIIGDGPERVPLEKQAADLGLSDNCIFTGMRVDTEVFLSAADIYVLPSVWEEAFSFSLLEAMASGCPVVSTRTGAIPESVQDGVTGILVPPRDAKATTDAILKLLNDEPLRLEMGLAARKRVEDHFSLDHWINQTIDLYGKDS